MGPQELDADPVEGTEAGRGPLRDNPMDAVMAGSPFGAGSEMVGIPSLTFGPPHVAAEETSRAGLSRGALAWPAIIVTVLIVLGAIAGLSFLHPW